ncbi:MAG: hypothetical protein EZS28_012543 [Streblomastix strix]|uniref:U-box domain-containing protein n=1 Tax=Streblomastix strix TaxID=222440 RepID=A0A5J4WAJ1_9EUKA|nr:MAG: hypothetical protein EZS28_012543 [Streblomastix strix]
MIFSGWAHTGVPVVQQTNQELISLLPESKELADSAAEVFNGDIIGTIIIETELKIRKIVSDSVAVKFKSTSIEKLKQFDRKDQLNEGFICPITQEAMIDPVIAEDGFSYERQAIVDWLKINRTSPITRQPMSEILLKPNIELKKQIQSANKYQNVDKILNESVMLKQIHQEQIITSHATPVDYKENAHYGNVDSILIYNPIITSGITYFEGYFGFHYMAGIGIADKSVRYRRNQSFNDYDQSKKTVRYFSDGDLRHFQMIGRSVEGNQQFDNDERVGLELDLSSHPTILTFFINGIEQKNYVTDIPTSGIRFYVGLYNRNCKFTVTRFEKREFSSRRGVCGSKSWEWEKYWQYK